MARRVLTESEHARFKQDGFLTLPGLAPDHDLVAVRTTLATLFENSGRTYGVIDHALDLAPQLKHSLVFQACERIAKELLGPTAAISFDQALYKPPHESIGTRWHQDQAFQGPHRPMNTVHFWIPLQSVNELNGCLHFMRGSHLLGLLPYDQCSPNDPYAITPRQLPPLEIVPCPLTLGDATIHLPLTLHHALPNRTGSIRRAWALLFKPSSKLDALNPLPRLRQLFRTAA